MDVAVRDGDDGSEERQRGVDDAGQCLLMLRMVLAIGKLALSAQRTPGEAARGFPSLQPPDWQIRTQKAVSLSRLKRHSRCIVSGRFMGVMSRNYFVPSVRPMSFSAGFPCNRARTVHDTILQPCGSLPTLALITIPAHPRSISDAGGVSQ